jgi:hypothetical protein
MYIKSLTILCISQLTLQAAQYVNLTDIKLNLLKQQKTNKEVYINKDISNIKTNLLKKKIETLKSEIEYGKEEQNYLETSLKVNEKKIDFLINSYKIDEAYVLFKHTEFVSLIKKEEYKRLFNILKYQDYKEMKYLNKNQIKIIINFFFIKISEEKVSIEQLNNFKTNVLKLSNPKITKDDKYRIFRDLEMLKVNFVNAYNYSYKIKVEQTEDKKIKKELKDILLLTEEIFINYYLQTSKEKMFKINIKGLSNE